jgi:hypothetical protein
MALLTKDIIEDVNPSFAYEEEKKRRRKRKLALTRADNNITDDYGIYVTDDYGVYITK